MELYTVYKHVSPKGKVYIGITHKYPAEKRWGKNGYGYKTQRAFARAIKKYPDWDKYLQYSESGQRSGWSWAVPGSPAWADVL